MEGDGIPLKEDSSFEILQFLDEDETLFKKIHNPKDKNQFYRENNSDDSYDSFCNPTSLDTISLIENSVTASGNFASLVVETAEEPLTIYGMNITEIENTGCNYPVFSPIGDKMMPSCSVKNLETNSVIPLNSEPMHKRKEKFGATSGRPYEVLVISTGKFNCCQVEEQYVPKEFANYRKKDNFNEEYSSQVSKSSQRNEVKEMKSGRIICEELVGNDVFLKRTSCNRKICQFVDNGIKFCSWLQNRKCVQSFVEKAKASFKSIASAVELEINQIIGSENPLRLSIISDRLSAQAIEEAFTEVFRGHVLASVISVDLEAIPALPIGNAMGLQAAEMKISFVRQNNLVPDRSVAVSTSIMLHQAVSQRWQMTTVICLEDPNLTLNLHNFTATTPIPNDYVIEAERQTLPHYHLREYGLAVDMKQAIDSVTKMTTQDPQEFLTGVSHHSTLKSAALLLAGIYKKYAYKCT